MPLSVSHDVGEGHLAELVDEVGRELKTRIQQDHHVVLVRRGTFFTFGQLLETARNILNDPLEHQRVSNLGGLRSEKHDESEEHDEFHAAVTLPHEREAERHKVTQAVLRI